MTSKCQCSDGVAAARTRRHRRDENDRFGQGAGSYCHASSRFDCESSCGTFCFFIIYLLFVSLGAIPSWLHLV